MTAIVVMGVSAAGKSSVASALSSRLDAPWVDADDLHPATNVAKMAAGIPLGDEDRWPWLERLRDQIKHSIAATKNAVLACSALKRAYRDRLRVSDDVKFVFLRGDYALIAEQLCQRRGHFMNPELLRSQFADLEQPEPDEDVLTSELGRTPQELVEEIKTKLRLAPKDSN